MWKSITAGLLCAVVLCCGCDVGRITKNVARAAKVNNRAERIQEKIQAMSPADREVFDKLQGSWIFFEPTGQQDLIYQFDSSGKIHQIDPESKLEELGMFVVDGGQIVIEWIAGGTEVATFDQISDAGFNYKIVNHTDDNQVGQSMEFKRQKP